LNLTERKLFVRQASGLVREVSTLKATFFNIAALSGNVVLLAIIFLPLYGGAAIGGFSPIGLAHIIAGISLIFMALIFVILVSVMPRSGGDYVFTSRVMHPFLGWLESWTLIFCNMAIMAFELVMINLSSQAFLAGMSAAYVESSWVGVSAWLSLQTNQLIFGTFITFLVALMALAKPRTFHAILSSLCILAILSALVMGIGTFLVDPATFSTNFQKFTSTSLPSILDSATTAGLSLAPLALTVFPSMFAFGLFDLIGFQYSGYIAGELKGNLKRNALLSMVGSVAIYLIVIWVILVPTVTARFGYDTVNAWGYLWWFAPSKAPLGGVAPTSALYGLIGRPDLWPLWLFVTIGGCVLMFSLCPAYLVMMSRMVYAWSMDRLVPEWFSKLDERTHTPLRVYLITLFGGWVFYVFSVYGLSALSLAWYSILLSAMTWIFPGFNVLLLPYRRKDLFEQSPWKGKIGPVPVVALIGLVWLIIIVPVYILSAFQPILATILQTPGQELWSYSTNSGITLSVVIILVGAALYFVSKAYQKHRGVDVDLIFKTIPPE
jgi:APA family basic amino acid/polyamine antiporter